MYSVYYVRGYDESTRRFLGTFETEREALSSCEKLIPLISDMENVTSPHIHKCFTVFKEQHIISHHLHNAESTRNV